MIQDDNQRIRNELIELQEKRGKEHQRQRRERENVENSREDVTETDLAPGLTLDQAIDLRRKYHYPLSFDVLVVCSVER